MADLFEPLIEPQHYDAIRRLVNPHLPDTPDEWADLQKQALEQLALSRHNVIMVKVDPDEFSRFLASTGAEPNLDALRRFAFDIHGGKKRY
jgi:hypothetical protein